MQKAERADCYANLRSAIGHFLRTGTFAQPLADSVNSRQVKSQTTNFLFLSHAGSLAALRFNRHFQFIGELFAKASVFSEHVGARLGRRQGARLHR